MSPLRAPPPPATCCRATKPSPAAFGKRDVRSPRPIPEPRRRNPRIPEPYPEIHAQFSVNEKVAIEVAFGASISGARAICAMKHVGMNVAADAFMTLTLTGVVGGLVIVVADDVGLSSSQNEQDLRYWGRFGHLPILEPADSEEAYKMTQEAFELSERFATPVILRTTTRVCHVKAMVTIGSRTERPAAGFQAGTAALGHGPQLCAEAPAGGAGPRPRPGRLHRNIPAQRHRRGTDRRIGFVTSGPTYLHLRGMLSRRADPQTRLQLSAPGRTVRRFAAGVDGLVVAEETEPLIEIELRAAGITVRGKTCCRARRNCRPAC